MLQRVVNFPVMLAAFFFVLLLVQVSNHVMWRDELRPWQIIRDCSTPADVIREMRFDAVPALWNLIIYGLTLITDNPLSMQLMHVLIATGVVYVVARWGPFSRAQKVLFSFGYFPFFEYATIARNYSLVLLLVVIGCALLSQPRVRWGWLGVTLFLLTQVSIWGVGFAGLLLVAAIVQGRFGPKEFRPSAGMVGVVVGCMVVGVGLCIVTILPGPGASFVSSWHGVSWSSRVFQSLGSIYRAWVPIPQWQMHFWNTNLLDSVPAIQAVVGVGLIISAVMLMARQPIAVGWMLLGCTALVAFTLAKFRSGARHDGMLFIVLIGGCWLAMAGPTWEIPWSWGRSTTARLERFRGLAFGVILSLSAIGGLMAAGQGMIYPFSATRAVADYIRNNVREPVVLAAHYDYCASPISQWLDRPFYSIAMRQDIQVNTQDDSARLHPSKVDGLFILNSVYELLQERRTTVLLMLNADVIIRHSDPMVRFPAGPGLPPRSLYFTDIVDPSFQRSVVADEGHRLYLVRFPVFSDASGGGGIGMGGDEPLVGEHARGEFQGHVLSVP